MNVSEQPTRADAAGNGWPAAVPTGLLMLVGFPEDQQEQLCSFLTRNGFDVNTTSISDARAVLGSSSPPATIILDLDTNPSDGLAALREICVQRKAPIIATTTQDSEVDRILALEMGADDCLGGQYSCRELLARIHAVMRRTDPESTEAPSQGKLVDGSLVVDCIRHRAYLDGEYLTLTNAEFRLLERLMMEQGDVVARSELAEYALGRELTPQDRCIDTHICRLRRKLGPGPGGDRRIHAVRGRGYLMPRVHSVRDTDRN